MAKRYLEDPHTIERYPIRRMTDSKITITYPVRYSSGTEFVIITFPFKVIDGDVCVPGDLDEYTYRFPLPDYEPDFYPTTIHDEPA